ncbi:hypothetical protein TSUD_176080 [Trifolium subterraneum]|uniref:Uncharacterized protein n=1 Tax=Trifolium subterraneum TaxID=3900 RepID=A0A2Z6LPF4_TRISU|nr:hypothetical protein TSUD_176080 [Trifolium subterraneum]
MAGIYLALSSLRLIMVIQPTLVMWWSVALNFDDSIEAQVTAAFSCSRVTGVVYLMEALNWMAIGNNFGMIEMLLLSSNS